MKASEGREDIPAARTLCAEAAWSMGNSLHDSRLHLPFPLQSGQCTWSPIVGTEGLCGDEFIDSECLDCTETGVCT